MVFGELMYGGVVARFESLGMRSWLVRWNKLCEKQCEVAIRDIGVLNLQYSTGPLIKAYSQSCSSFLDFWCIWILCRIAKELHFRSD